MKTKLFLLSLFLLPASSWAKTYTLHVKGLVCDFCAQGIEKKLSEEFKDQKIENIRIDLDKKTVTFQSDPLDEVKITKIIESAGFDIKKIESKD